LTCKKQQKEINQFQRFFSSKLLLQEAPAPVNEKSTSRSADSEQDGGKMKLDSNFQKKFSLDKFR
jgi:hypothetical protein